VEITELRMSTARYELHVSENATTILNQCIAIQLDFVLLVMEMLLLLWLLSYLQLLAPLSLQNLDQRHS